jgi:hypothetical protein
MSLTSYLPLLEFNPAGLSSVEAITVNRTGTDGTIYAHVEHKNDILGIWRSLAGVIGEMTPIGKCENGDLVPLPAFECREGEVVRVVLQFVRDDPAVPVSLPYEVLFYFATDLEVPDAPAIGGIFSVVNGSVIGFAVDFSQTAHHVVMEIKINDDDWLAVPGEITATRMAFDGYLLDDIVQVRIKSVKAVGLESDWVESPILTLESTNYTPVWVPSARLQIRNRQRISMRVRT